MSHYNTRIICENVWCPDEFQKFINVAEKNLPPSTRSHPNSYLWTLMYCEPSSEDDILGFAQWVYRK